MTETFNDVLIDGVDDVKQLRVQGHTTQNQSLQTWEDSASDILAQMTGDGRLQLGDDLGFASPDALIEAHRNDDQNNPSEKPKRAFHALGRVSAALNNITQWIVQELEVHDAENLSALQTALRVRASNMNTGTPQTGAELRAADIEVINEASAGSAALPKATGLQVGVTNAAGKTITQAVGLYVKMQNEGTITTPYSIFTEGTGAAHFEDYVELKSLAASPGTPATDFMRIYPKSDGNLYTKNWNGTEVQLGGGGASFGNQSANTVFAGPTSGGVAAPAFRLLDPADIPSLDAAKITSGVLNNARVNWAAPGAIGSTTPAAVTGTQLRVLPSSGDSTLLIDGATGTNRIIVFRKASDSTPRWAVYASGEAEAGGNAGSNFAITHYSDTGTYLGAAMTITRATGTTVHYGDLLGLSPNGITQDNGFLIGVGRTGNGYAHIDLIGDTTYSSYGLRIIRDNTGANAFSRIVQRGTGTLRVEATDGAAIAFYITDMSTNKFSVGSTGASVNGSLNVSGALYKGSGTFRIDHPLDPENKLLYHGFVEAPRYDLIYRGSVQLEEWYGNSEHQRSEQYDRRNFRGTYPKCASLFTK